MHVERVSWLIIYKLWIMNTFGHFLVGQGIGSLSFVVGKGKDYKILWQSMDGE